MQTSKLRSVLVRTCVVAVAALLALAAAPPADASCQTAYCHQQRRHHDRQREADLRQSLLAEPDDATAVRNLLGLLERKVYREKEIADYETRYTWRVVTVAADLEARVGDEMRLWSDHLARLEADDPAVLCRRARSLADPAARLAATEALVEERPEEPRLATCHARELEAQDRRAEAVAHLHGFLDRHADPAVADALIELSGDDAKRGLLEELAARRLDDFASQQRLLRYLAVESRDPDARQEALRFARRLLAGEPSADEVFGVCSALAVGRHRDDGFCWRQLVDGLFPGADAETVEHYREMAYRSLFMRAVHDRDWVALEPLFERQPAGEHVDLWARAVDFSHGDLCPRFLAAYGRGLPHDDEDAARQLADVLRRCGDEDRAGALLRATGLLRDDGVDLTRDLDVARYREHALSTATDALPDRRKIADFVERADARVRRQLAAWAADEPAAVEPLLYLAAVDEALGRPEEALASLEAAGERRPDDLDLVVALGAAALRFDHPDRVRQAARRLRTAPGALPRHQAEALYLLGRLDRREGRMDDASDRLATYFLARLRHEGCLRWPDCDRALLAHLAEAGDRDRLDAYLTARAEAWDAFAESSGLSFEDAPRLPNHRRGFRPLAPPDPRLLVPEGDGGERPDVEALFPDNALLGFFLKLREVG